MARKITALGILLAALGCSGSTQTTSTGGSGTTATGTSSTATGTTGKSTSTSTSTSTATSSSTTATTTATTTTATNTGTTGNTGNTTATTTTTSGTTGTSGACTAAGAGAIDCTGLPTADAGLISAFAAGSQQFALNLFGAIVVPDAGSNDSNVFIAPYSVSAAFAMAYAGADSPTATQMAQVFSYPADPTDLAPAVAGLGCELEADGVGPDGGQLDLANAFFGQIDAGFLQPFTTLLSTDFGAPLQQIDFTQVDNATQVINQWVSEHTDCFIPHLLQPGDLQPTDLWALVNASYFHGAWTYPFATNLTSSASFTNGAGASVSVQMMTSGPGTVYAPYFQASGFQALEMQVKQAQIAVDLLLPASATGLPALEATLTPATLQSTFSSLAQSPVFIQIPKLSLDTSIDLSSTLQTLGLTLPFPPGSGYFTNILPGMSQIAAVRHEGVLQLDEGGLSAAGATAILGSTGGSTGQPNPPSFIANHPFLIVIRDVTTGVILFMGQVNDPTQS